MGDPVRLSGAQVASDAWIEGVESPEFKTLIDAKQRSIVPMIVIYGQGEQAGFGRQVSEIVFLLSRHSVFADEPSLVPWQMLLALVPDLLRRSPEPTTLVTNLISAFKAVDLTFGLDQRGGLTITS
jgi:hypothetical protein